MANIDFTPIKTVYNGYLFKSKLEAKWAVFFDNMGFVYEYEPEAFGVGDGWYTPDFYIPEMYLGSTVFRGVYAEIKPSSWDCELEYYVKLSRAMRNKILVLFAGEPYDFAIPYWESYGHAYRVCPEWDKHQTLAYCGECNDFGVQYLEESRKCCPHCDSMRNGPTMLNAAIDARQKKFFHK